MPNENVPAESWDSFIQQEIADHASEDDQPETESEETAEEETEQDVVEPDSEEKEIEEETDEEEVESEEDSEEESEEQPETLTDETEIDMGEDRNPVTLKELKDGYLRQSDYTKKTQKLADERKELERQQESLKPAQDFQKYMDEHPYVMQKFQEFVQKWNQIGDIPSMEEVMDTESGPYINHLMAENQRLQKELDRISGEYQTTKFDTEMKSLESDLKAEYGDLVTDEYMQNLRKQAEEEKLSPDTLKRIAKGDLAEQKLQQEREQTKKDKKKQEAKTVQNLREKRKKVPPQPKKTGQKPKEEQPDYSSMDWGEFIKSVVD